MKVIELLNKIANGEIKLGTKFNWHYKLYDIELIFTERQGALGLYFQKGDRLIGLFERFNYQILNDEVEILEEEKKIPEKLYLYEETQNIIRENNYKLVYHDIHKCIVSLECKYNQLIDYLKSKGDE